MKDLQGTSLLYCQGNVYFDPGGVECVSGAGGVVHYFELFNDVLWTMAYRHINEAGLVRMKHEVWVAVGVLQP